MVTFGSANSLTLVKHSVNAYVDAASRATIVGLPVAVICVAVAVDLVNLELGDGSVVVGWARGILAEQLDGLRAATPMTRSQSLAWASSSSTDHWS